MSNFKPEGRTHKSVGYSFNLKTIKRIEKTRGDVSKTRFVEKIVIAKLDKLGIKA
jgi:hypothetical protein